MIVPATQGHFAAIIANHAPAPWRLVADSAIAPPEVLNMLGSLAAKISGDFTPSAWLILDDGEIVGLLSLVAPIAKRSIRIGYGVAPSRENRGTTSRAVAEFLEWARNDPRVDQVTAETSPDHPSSQRVLAKNGFVRIDTRIDAEDGDLIVWGMAV